MCLKILDQITAGTDPDAVIWTCTDGNNPRSVCQKTCRSDHKKQGYAAGAYSVYEPFARRCNCRGTCEWDIHLRTTGFYIDK